MIPPFHAALDRCLSYLEPQNGLLGVADFYVSAKHDLPLRQQPWARRFFWQATFDTDGISIGPERRAYLDNRLSRLWEMNSQVSWILSFQEHWLCPGGLPALWELRSQVGWMLERDQLSGLVDCCCSHALER